MIKPLLAIEHYFWYGINARNEAKSSVGNMNCRLWIISFKADIIVVHFI